MLESPSGSVTYRHGVAVVSLFSRDMWVPPWVTGVGSVLHLHSGTLRDTVKPDDGHDWAETSRLILTRIYILRTN
jgi:hypothetical protein